MKKFFAIVLVMSGCVAETQTEVTQYEGTTVIALAIATTGSAALFETPDSTEIGIDGCVIPVTFDADESFREDGLSIECDYGDVATALGHIDGTSLFVLLEYSDGRILTFEGEKVE